MERDPFTHRPYNRVTKGYRAQRDVYTPKHESSQQISSVQTAD